MKQVTYYETEDGETFKNQDDAQAHETMLAIKRRIDAVLPILDEHASIGEVRARSRDRRVVMAFLQAEADAEAAAAVASFDAFVESGEQ